MPRTTAHRACDDFHRTGEAERVRFLEQGLTRRQIVVRGAGAGLAIYAARALSLGSSLDAASAAGAASPEAPVLVSVFLPGGCDLLDTIVPLDQYGRYADRRPTLRQAENVPRLAGTGLGLNPGLAQGIGGGIAGLAARGRVGFLPGIDYANPDLSHFHSRTFWETGLISAKGGTGWLGRWLDAEGSKDNPLQALSLSGTVSPVLRSNGAPVAALESAGDARPWMGGLWQDSLSSAWGAYGRIAAGTGGGGGADAAGRAARQMAASADRLDPYAHRDGERDPLAGTVAYPDDNPLAARLGTLAGLLSKPLGVRVAAVDVPRGFDTHDNQKDELTSGLGLVSEALSAFQADLEARGLADRVITFVWSEFGRRAEQNRSGGTDHGAGGMAWVQGTRVRGPLLSEFPSLGALDAYGNLPVTVDFRRVYASLVEGWLGSDAEAVLPGARRLGRIPLVG